MPPERFKALKHESTGEKTGESGRIGENDFVQSDEKWAPNGSKVHGSFLFLVDDTHGNVCMRSENDTPGYVYNGRGWKERREGAGKA